MKSKLSAQKDLELLKCAKNIHLRKSKYNDPKQFSSWEKQIEELEKEYKNPDYKRKRYLQKIFNNKEIQDLVDSGAEIVEEKFFCHEFEDSIQSKENSDTFIRKSKSAPVRPTQKKYSNPFMEFMNKSKNDARSWYPKQEIKIQDLPVIERAEILKKNVVKQFVGKFHSVLKSNEVNETTVNSIFEMTCPFPIQKINTRSEICGTVTETTAKYLGCHELSENNKLRKEILQDIVASQIPESKIAFGRTLPKKLRRGRFKENPAAKWMKKNNEHEKLETFTEVWKDITELESTRKFCQFLLEHPSVVPPPFLKNEGMMTRRMLKRSVYLGNLEKILENTDSIHLLDISTILNDINETMADFNNRLIAMTMNSSSSLGDVSEVKIPV